MGRGRISISDELSETLISVFRTDMSVIWCDILTLKLLAVFCLLSNTFGVTGKGWETGAGYWRGIRGDFGLPQFGGKSHRHETNFNGLRLIQYCTYVAIPQAAIHIGQLCF
jgi:hypothetical protein